MRTNTDTCDDCRTTTATVRYWQSGGTLGQRTFQEADRKGLTYKLCGRCDRGINPSVWTKAHA